ncbi:sarcosine oxidase subunit gamma [Mesorhizobium sp. VK23B]|uniref:Sarcosine oxidase subunit gamma n=1 Tax=Mesorhizobium dulcispinae TaxID=3072316 RepID=A0ABU4XFE4_9HYPH|nr:MULTISPECIES: sarcosine oxidase subunit gamma [unclassified Mesorhizobium]MDX8466879.1 sarcosine oxidase subunit gamma [Mesorhizobium sp. VK23B]MDX8473502.1 sarcosine oxidase subunit gamma [Mesorhizobium sp. VK23A]
MAETVSVEACTILQVEGWPETQAACESELSRQLGAALPADFGEAAAVGGWFAVRIAPRRFWLIADDGSKPNWSIDPALGCSVSLGEGRMRLKLRGPHTFDVLKACVAIDWDSPQARPGSALQTGFHHVPVLLLRTGAEACDIFAPRSFAQSLVDWLADIGVSRDIQDETISRPA